MTAFNIYIRARTHKSWRMISFTVLQWVAVNQVGTKVQCIVKCSRVCSFDKATIYRIYMNISCTFTQQEKITVLVKDNEHRDPSYEYETRPVHLSASWMQHQIVPPGIIHSIWTWFANENEGNGGTDNLNYSTADESHRSASLWTWCQIARKESVYAYFNLNL